jgi:radical SAM protein with 4Fe4S-binding SPASM domain
MFKSENQQDLLVYLKTTDTCQLNCEHCFTSGSNGKKGFFDPDKTIDWFYRLKSRVPNYRNAQVVFHGGEPFLAPVSSMRKVWEACHELWPNLTWSCSTNLVYKLDDEKIDFMSTCLNKNIATSWDKGIRFSNNAQEDLWRANVKKLTKEMGFTVTMMVSLNKAIIEQEPLAIIEKAAEVGASYLHLERITPNGNAKSNSHIFPDNKALDEWFFKLYQQVIENKCWEWGPQILFLNSILTSLVYSTHSGCRCRACEQKIFTINANGSIGGCPNSAPEHQFGTIEDPIHSLLFSPGRMKNIQCESTRDPRCYTCPVYDVCNGDCHQLSWQGDVCASPKKLMTYLKEAKKIDEYKQVLNGFFGSE